MNNWKIALIIASVLIAATLYYKGIASNIEDEDDVTWKKASIEYTCSYEQYSKVMLETNYCKAETRFTGRYCYSSAVMRNCSKIAAAELPANVELPAVK